MEEKITTLMQDQEFVDKIMNCEEPEQVQALFAENDVELTVDEVKAIGQALAAVSDSDGELNEDDLEGIAGGVAASAVISALTATVKLGVNVYRNWGTIRRWFRRW